MVHRRSLPWPYAAKQRLLSAAVHLLLWFLRGMDFPAPVFSIRVFMVSNQHLTCLYWSLSHTYSGVVLRVSPGLLSISGVMCFQRWKAHFIKWTKSPVKLHWLLVISVQWTTGLTSWRKLSWTWGGTCSSWTFTCLAFVCPIYWDLLHTLGNASAFTLAVTSGALPHHMGSNDRRPP